LDFSQYFLKTLGKFRETQATQKSSFQISGDFNAWQSSKRNYIIKKIWHQMLSTIDENIIESGQ
jgi:hypothetical protein